MRAGETGYGWVGPKGRTEAGPAQRLSTTMPANSADTDLAGDTLPQIYAVGRSRDHTLNAHPTMTAATMAGAPIPSMETPYRFRESGSATRKRRLAAQSSRKELSHRTRKVKVAAGSTFGRGTDLRRPAGRVDEAVYVGTLEALRRPAPRGFRASVLSIDGHLCLYPSRTARKNSPGLLRSASSRVAGTRGDAARGRGAAPARASTSGLESDCGSARTPARG